MLKKSRRHFNLAATRFQKLENPFRFQGSSKYHSMRLSFYVSTAALVSISFSIAWLVFSPQFAITKINLETQLFINPLTIQARLTEQMQRKRWRVVPQWNLLGFDNQAFAEALRTEFAVSDVRIKKTFPHALTIGMPERSYSALWSTRNQFYALDAQGVSIGKILFSEKDPNTLLIYDQSGGEVSPRAQILTPATLNFIIRLRGNAQINALRPQFFIMPAASSPDVIMKVDKAWKAYFDSTGDMTTQIEKLDLTLRHTIPPDAQSKLDYIDVRFGERAYVKY